MITSEIITELADYDAQPHHRIMVANARGKREMTMTTAGPASKRQTWAIFCATGYDVRDCEISESTASTLLDQWNNQGDSGKKAVFAILEQTDGAVQKRKSTKAKSDHLELFTRAFKAGITAGNAHAPTPMVVQGYENQPIMDGVCGFAWINVRPGTSSFARWLVKEKGCRKSYHGGIDVWIHEFNQSYERKLAAAHAMADVLRKAGINAYGQGRID